MTCGSCATGRLEIARPRHQPDDDQRRQVEAMAGYGVPEVDIALVIAIDPKTLRKHYRKELKMGHVKANMKVAENLYRKATGEGKEAITASIFWLKTRAGWKETSISELNHRVGVEDPFQKFLTDVGTRGRKIHDKD